MRGTQSSTCFSGKILIDVEMVPKIAVEGQAPVTTIYGLKPFSSCRKIRIKRGLCPTGYFGYGLDGIGREINLSECRMVNE